MSPVSPPPGWGLADLSHAWNTQYPAYLPRFERAAPSATSVRPWRVLHRSRSCPYRSPEQESTYRCPTSPAYPASWAIPKAAAIALNRTVYCAHSALDATPQSSKPERNSVYRCLGAAVKMPGACVLCRCNRAACTRRTSNPVVHEYAGCSTRWLINGRPQDR